MQFAGFWKEEIIDIIQTGQSNREYALKLFVAKGGGQHWLYSFCYLQ